MTTVILVRHGQTEWNQVERFRGRADLQLTETGLAQARAAGRRIAAEWRPQAIFTSPLSRAVKTAEAIGEACALPVQVHPGLVDIDYGDWQGLTIDEARARWPSEISAWFGAPHLARIPGGETLDALHVRAMAAVEELVARQPVGTMVMVGHTVINRVILLAVLDLGHDRFWRLRQETGAVNVFEAQPDGYTLVSLNDVCHLRSIPS
jgi:broad specificity phosphatase PhoE